MSHLIRLACIVLLFLNCARAADEDAGLLSDFDNTYPGDGGWAPGFLIALPKPAQAPQALAYLKQNGLTQSKYSDQIWKIEVPNFRETLYVKQLKACGLFLRVNRMSAGAGPEGQCEIPKNAVFTVDPRDPKVQNIATSEADAFLTKTLKQFFAARPDITVSSPDIKSGFRYTVDIAASSAGPILNEDGVWEDFKIKASFCDAFLEQDGSVTIEFEAEDAKEAYSRLGSKPSTGHFQAIDDEETMEFLNKFMSYIVRIHSGHVDGD